MKVLTISDVRRNLAAVMDAVIDDAEECIVARNGGKAAVILSLDEWNAVNETLHVLGSASNARHLLESIAQADAGLLEEHSLDLGSASPTDTSRTGRRSGMNRSGLVRIGGPRMHGPTAPLALDR